MTRGLLYELALRFGIIRWDKSGIIEVLHVERGQQIWAKRVVAPTRAHEISPSTDYHCREVEPTEMIRVGDLLL